MWNRRRPVVVSQNPFALINQVSDKRDGRGRRPVYVSYRKRVLSAARDFAAYIVGLRDSPPS